MSLIERTYPDIVRDILTNLTAGVTRETHLVEYSAQAPAAAPDLVLRNRPVRRISYLAGFVAGRLPDDDPVPYVFTDNDYVLVSSKPGGQDLDTIRFTAFGRKPAPNTTVTVNYYPRNAAPAVLTDLNVGSVTRTLLEALSREFAVLYEQLNLCYDSAFVETATGASLDRVTALVGTQRFRAGRSRGEVTFSRRAGATGNITIPAGTPVTDASDKVRYETVETHEMLSGETTATVRVVGASASVPPVETGKLTVIQRAIAGLERVINERPTARSSEDETDDELRSRARHALLAANKGTVEAIRNGLLEMPQVRSVQVTEMPNGVPGEISVAVSLKEPLPGGGLPADVNERLQSLRSAGIRLIPSVVKPLQVDARVHLLLNGSTLPAADLDALKAAVAKTIGEEIRKKGAGEKIRVRPIAAKLLNDARIADAELTVGPSGQKAEAGTDLEVPADSVAELTGSPAIDVEFSQPAVTGPVTIQVRASVTLTLVAGTTKASAETALKTKLAAYLKTLQAGSAVTGDAVLGALRDDTSYAIAADKLTLALNLQGQSVLITKDGTPFTVQAGQSFEMTSLEAVVPEVAQG